MNKDTVKQLLGFIGSTATGARNEWVVGRCPFTWRHGGKDVHPSFGIKSETKKKSICKCWSCGYGGDLRDLVFDLKKELKTQPNHQIINLAAAMQLIAQESESMDINPESIPEFDAPYEPPEIVVFSEDWLNSFSKAHLFIEASDYLRNRGVSAKMTRTLDIRYDPISKRVCFPFRNNKKELIGVQGRDISEKTTLRYYQYGYTGKRNGTVWMGENLINLDQPLVLVEGPFDYTSVLRVYGNVAASFTSGLSVEKIKRIADATEIITLYDYGNGGNAARAALSKKLTGVPITHLIPSAQEDDAGNMSLEQVTQHLKGHVKLYDYNTTWN